jgi:hypothetical protein
MLSDKSLLLKAFNKQMFDFLDDIIGIVQENEQIKISRVYFETLKKANPTLLIKIWYNRVFLPYGEKIANGNIDYFLEKDYSDDLANLPNGKEVVKIINTSLREPIQQMDMTNKEHCMKYIQILCKISDAYTAQV